MKSYVNWKFDAIWLHMDTQTQTNILIIIHKCHEYGYADDGY